MHTKRHFLAWCVAAHPLRHDFQPPSTPIGTGATSAPDLQAFQEAAQQGQWLHVSRDGAQWQVKASGTTPSQRAVAWVEPDHDTTSAFVTALGQSFSRGVQSAVARELGLDPAPGRPLSGRLVQQAIEMARTSENALSGVDFFTRLQASAQHGSTAFAQVCQELGHDPARISPQTRAQIDQRVQQQFDAAQAQRLAPVPDGQARQWLLEAVRELVR